MSLAANITLLFAAFLLAGIGGIALALSQARNWRAVTGTRVAVARARVARRIGYALVFASLALCVARDGWGFAALLWPLLLGAVSVLTALMLAFRSQWLRRFAAVLAAIPHARISDCGPRASE